MSLTLALTTALSGLMTSQKGLDVVSSNIANVNTEGYSRKLFNAESVVLAGTGAGVQAGEITRRVEQGVQDDMRTAKGLYSQLQLSSDYMDRIQDIFGTPSDNSSLSHIVNDLSEQFELLALESDKGTQADEVVRAGQELAIKLNTMSEQVQSLRTDADRQISTSVDQVNTILANIDSLNDKISLASATTGSTADLLDKRDSQLNALAQLIDVTYYERESGAISVFTNSGATLLDSEPNYLSHTALSSVQPWDSLSGSDFDSIEVNGVDITSDIRGGKLKGLIEMRDEELVNLQAQIDELSDSLIDKVNQVNNRGTSFPSMNSDYTGTRTFIDSSTQQISINSSSADTAIVIFDEDGNQQASTTLRNIIGDTINGGSASGGPITIDDLATNLTSWLNNANGGGMSGASAAVDANGHFTISLNSSSYGLSFRDQESSVPGDATSDLPISFDSSTNSGSFQAYESDEGFSNFLGLNDFFTDGGQDNWLWESSILSESYTQTGSSVINITATDSSGTVQTHSITLANGDTLQDIADRINNDETLQGKIELRASVVDEGNGVRLRLRNIEGTEMSVTGNSASDSRFASLGLSPAATGSSSVIQVNETLELSPDLVSKGIVQYNSDTGEFYLSTGDNTNANALASLFTSVQSFDSAGGLTTGNLTFADYASSVISSASSRASSLESSLTYQTSLAQSLELKNSEISSVNLDEELSQLMIFEQSYSAAAKVISTTQQMFDVLDELL